MSVARAAGRFWIHLFLIGGLLAFGLAACVPTPRSTAPLHYPSDVAQQVREVCTLVFQEPYWEYVSPSRKRKLMRFQVESWGIVAVFADQRSYQVPLQTRLTVGETHSCNFGSGVTPCASKTDWDSRCEFDPDRRPDRFGS
ncbi:MAG: hypothetical protein CL923_00825 [Deltaproteobacteria bacterium]|nr:hypothetical protein [Deltaproteobacteria bacterium]MDP7157079.1 hypothetical protein [SAR324 cluster bacterium]MDP7317491.1 hypothetical protein [SAR324 cluster bacterium]MDP7463423.1 hypothetical protein [SAR324 cluster bacterium]MDP7629830.1 hypothetical protein [SAR324 cluster bacterium]